MNIIKEKGHNVNLSNLVIHKINKNAGDKMSSLKIAEEEIVVKKQEVKFIASIRESFNKRSVPTHGVFEDENGFNGFQQAIKDYVDGKIKFMQFSIDSMNYYKRIIETSAPATGGFLIFADYKITDNNNERYILVLSIDNKQGYNLSDVALAIQEIQSLELNKMDLASIINLTRWEQSTKSNHEIKTYLTFVRGKKKISDYFQTFIGCADKTTATESSRLLLNTINQFIIEKEFKEPLAKEIRAKVLEYCQNCNKNKKEILLSQISMLLNEEEPEEFATYATDEKFGNSEVIKFDSKILRTLKYVDYQSEDLTIKFNKSLVGKSISISKDKNSITFSNLPEDLKIQF
jgi:nucleoid-associated protein